MIDLPVLLVFFGETFFNSVSILCRRNQFSQTHMLFFKQYNAPHTTLSPKYTNMYTHTERGLCSSQKI